MRSWAGIKHRVKWGTKAGELYRGILTMVGLLFLKMGRRLLKRSLGRCSWCGLNPYFNSTISGKGLRCRTFTRDCTSMP